VTDLEADEAWIDRHLSPEVAERLKGIDPVLARFIKFTAAKEAIAEMLKMFPSDHAVQETKP
jgi:hypothetical protein